jgi:hypothetical protein
MYRTASMRTVLGIVYKHRTSAYNQLLWFRSQVPHHRNNFSLESYHHPDPIGQCFSRSRLGLTGQFIYLGPYTLSFTKTPH